MAKLPNGYIELEYIQSQNGQYINTGLYANGASTKIVADVKIYYSSNWTMLIGSYDDRKYFSWWTNGSQITGYYGSSWLHRDGTTERVVLVADKNMWSLDDQTMNFAQNNFTADSPIYLFSVSNGGNFAQGSMRLYSCQIYDNDTLLRDYVPCFNGGGDVGLYDLVESKFYGNDGRGLFIPGKEVRAPSMYVKLDGHWKPVENMVIS